MYIYLKRERERQVFILLLQPCGNTKSHTVLHSNLCPTFAFSLLHMPCSMEPPLIGGCSVVQTDCCALGPAKAMSGQSHMDHRFQNTSFPLRASAVPTHTPPRPGCPPHVVCHRAHHTLPGQAQAALEMNCDLRGGSSEFPLQDHRFRFHG